MSKASKTRTRKLKERITQANRERDKQNQERRQLREQLDKLQMRIEQNRKRLGLTPLTTLFPFTCMTLEQQTKLHEFARQFAEKYVKISEEEWKRFFENIRKINDGFNRS